ncbi:hypothetical protein [Cohnella abietis]|uniref:Uncharacterized protein n=1 Tax=Cohnella abietis TaxID=2507935 RepID=A0A3T1D4J8_9BACL|nr:hypothetical protein [Cohnella abietis]BBI32991.1 hypothetical protein KCTCHS21_23900 [Cohnella abietis]
MAFGITRNELNEWKKSVTRGETAFLTHYWYDARFPEIQTVTKVGNANLERLKNWCITHGLNPKYIHLRPPFPHFDLMGSKQREILIQENLTHHLERFKINK